MFIQDILFSKEECDEIIKFHLNHPKPYYAENEKRDNVKYVAYTINPKEEGKWIFDKLKNFFTSKSGIEVTNIPDKMYLHHYIVNDGFKKHWDKNKPEREWNVGIQLNSNFVGGDFNLFYEDKVTIDKTEGNTYIFKSEVFHEVTPLIQGERWSLIMFLHYEHISQKQKKSLL